MQGYTGIFIGGNILLLGSTIPLDLFDDYLKMKYNDVAFVVYHICLDVSHNKQLQMFYSIKEINLYLN